MDKLQVFQSSLFSAIRATLMDDEPWFVGSDVAQALGYEQKAKAVRDHVDNEDMMMTNQLATTGHDMIFINESGVYSLIFNSKQERSREFKRWVTHEVLPALRRTGQYSMGQSRPALNSEDYFKALKLIGSARADRLPYLFETFKTMGLDLPEPSALLSQKPEKEFQRQFWQRRPSVPKSYKQFRETSDEVAMVLRKAYDCDISFSLIAERSGVNRSQLYKYMWGDRLLRDEALRQSVTESANSLIAIAAGENTEQ